jgi:putative tricarboxylic transport membrane protein
MTYFTPMSLRPLIALLVFVSLYPQAATWKPDQTVEIVVGTAPGSGPDRSARFIQQFWQQSKLVEAQSVVINKPGPSSTLSGAYVYKFAGSGHHVLLSGKAILTSDIAGRLPFRYGELTPITHYLDEYIGIAVKADSPIKSGRDLAERLKKDPALFSVGVATSIGNANHQAVAAAMKVAGVDIRRMRNVVFQSGGAAVTAMLGGHVDIVPVSIGSYVGELQAGRVRVIAVSSPRRLSGVFADVPTWREQGIDSTTSVWRGAFGAKGLSAAQIAYWENVFQRMMAASEWQKETESTYGVSEFMGSARTRKFMEQDHAQERAFLAELGLIKPAAKP